MGPVSFTSLGISAVVVSALLAYYNIQKENIRESKSGKIVATSGKPKLGGPWVLVDQDGIPRTDASYKGQFMLLYFGFTHCPDICPSELVKVGKILEQLEKQNIQVKPVFISVDPARDCLEQLKHYSQDFHKSFSYLTGTNEQVKEAARSYRVYFSKANEDENDDEEYLVDHSIVFYFVSPTGEFVDFFTQKTQVNDVVEKIKGYVKDYAATSAAPTSTAATHQQPQEKSDKK